ncbi:MAG: thioredoxin family protein, partial [Chitinophagales bacterium]|nr:thioredoxin family protein [Chitinophagales bacterium]
HKLNGMTIYLNYDDAIAAAKIANKPVMIDFTGWACVNCRKMEEGVWKQPGVYELLNEKYIIASLYVDERIALPADQQDSSVVLKKRMTTVGEKWTDMQIANFQQVSQPFYALIDPRTERLLNNPRGNTPEVKVYKDFLACGWETYKGQK